MAFRFRKDSKAEYEKFTGYKDLHWDEEYLEPPEGFPPIQTVKEYPTSVWDEALWRPSKNNRPRRLITKTQAMGDFLLTNNDLLDFVYRYEMGRLGYMSKKFLYRQVQRRAWEKYGGPTGLKAAKDASRDAKTASKSDGVSKTKDGKVKGEIKKGRAREPSPVSRKRKRGTFPPAMPIPSMGADTAVQGEKTIPSTPRKRGHLVRLDTHPGSPMSLQDNVAGPSTQNHGRISTRQSLSGPTPTGGLSSHAYRSTSSAVTALDDFVARSPTLTPVKRPRDNKPGPSTSSGFKRQRVYWPIDDDDDEPPPGTPTPLSSPLKGKMVHTRKSSSPPSLHQKSTVQDDVLELTGSEDDYVPMKLISSRKSKSVSPAKKGLALIRDDEVIDISD